MEKYGYVYLTRITTSKNVVWYAGQHEGQEFDAKYVGSGKVLVRMFKKYGKTAAIEKCECSLVGWASSREELDQLEIDLIAWARAEYGKRCVNSADGGDGLTSTAAKKIMARPSTKRKLADATRETWQDGEFRAARSAALSEQWQNSELRAKRVAGLTKKWQDSAFRSKQCANKSAGNDPRYSAAVPFRKEWAALIPLRRQLGIKIKRPSGFAGPKTWQKAVEDLRVLIANHKAA